MKIYKGDTDTCFYEQFYKSNGVDPYDLSAIDPNLDIITVFSRTSDGKTKRGKGVRTYDATNGTNGAAVYTVHADDVAESGTWLVFPQLNNGGLQKTFIPQYVEIEALPVLMG